MIKDNKNLWIGVVAVIAVVIIVFWAVSNNNSASNVEQSGSTGQSMSSEDASAGSVNSGSTAASISYQNALIKYQGARLQLDQNCQASPDKMTFKNNANIMIDNRSSVARTVRVGLVYSVKAYGFKIIKLSSSKLPATWYVDCDGSQNVSTILIQK